MSRPRTAARRALFLQYMNPGAYPPLLAASRLLADAGWEVRFLGVKLPGTEPLDLPPHPRIRARLLPPASGRALRGLHYATFTTRALAQARAWRPTAVYASDPTACPAALCIEVVLRTPIVYHEHDAPAPSASPFGRICAAARSRLAARARLCVLPSAGRQRAFQSAHPHARSQVVWNCPHPAWVRPRLEADSGAPLRLHYHGTLGEPRIPRALINALALLPQGAARLQVVGYETAGSRYGDELQERARATGVQGALQVLGPRSHESLLDLAVEADVGLALLAESAPGDAGNYAEMVGASNKPFEYMAAGLGLLVSDLPAWRTAYVEPGYGLACDRGSPNSIAQAIRWFAEHRDALRQMGTRGRERILSEWNYERQFEPVLACLEALP